MTEGYEDDWLVRVRAQVMCREEGTGCWVALGGGGLANVMVGKRPSKKTTSTTNNGGSGGESGSEEDGKPLPRVPSYDYFIYGKRISDQSVVLSCTIKKDFQYNKVMPTFHHWVTDEKRFGLTFQTAADARAFDKGVRSAIEELLDGLGGAWPALDVYKNIYPGPREEDEDNIFERVDLPGDSRSSSENSTASRLYRNAQHNDAQTPILSPITLPYESSTDANKKRNSETPLSLRPDAEGEDYSYVHLTPLHEYTYPQLGNVDKSCKPPLSRRDSGSIKKPSSELSSSGPPPLPYKTHNNVDLFIRSRVRCRHCQEWYIESANRPGACEYAPDCFRSCIDAASGIFCAQCMLYHCMSDSEGDYSLRPCACGPPDPVCTKRWLAVTILSIFVPCLWCYPLLRCCHRAARSCGVAGGKHAPQSPSFTHR